MKGDLQKLISRYSDGESTTPLPERILRAKTWLSKEITARKVELAKNARWQNNLEFYKKKKITPLTALKQLIEDMERALRQAQEKNK
jgi:hypothetical protein